MKKLILVRHGESIWNQENKFTGWTDIELTEKGKLEAKTAGMILKKYGFTFDVAYTSVLKRAIDTLNIIIKELNLNIPINYSYKLNERHYGALQGLNKDKIKKEYGEEQFKLWRRSFYEMPPLLDKSDPRYPGNDPKYKDLDESQLPLGESLDLTTQRVIPYYENNIKKDILEGKRVIVVAHGNSLRALMKHLDNLSEDEVINLEIATGVPICYEFDDNLNVINHYFVGDKNEE